MTRHTPLLWPFLLFRFLQTLSIEKRGGTSTAQLSNIGMIPTIQFIPPTVTYPLCHDATRMPLIPIETPTIPPINSTLPHTSPYIVAAHSSPPSPPTSQILPTPPGLPRRPAIPVLPSQPIPFGQPCHTQPNRVHHFSFDDSSLDSPPDSSSRYSSDTSSGRSTPHFSFDTPFSFVGPSRKRRESPVVSVPLATPVPGTLSPVHADLLPPHKRIRGAVTTSDYDDCAEESYEACMEPDIDSDVQADINGDTVAAKAATAREADVGVEVGIRSDGEDKAEEDAESEDRGTIEIGVDMVIESV
ncbi:hypothetical protein Tco_1058716 [Tanacetum coccineum]|uniref:Uncharacterized protein n=1 Tax=Tanacetum coccineum TaxID=301880 RepID=A0ABQ5HA98_9ASTR